MTADRPTIADRPTSAGVALAVRGLRKRYGAVRALDGLDLTVPGGVVYGFLGPNGAGKTTTLRILTGLARADGGSVELLGRPFHRDRRRLFEVGALIETPSFYPYLSGRENLRALAATGAAVAAGRIEELLHLVGLDERADDRVGTYSLGMKQRLGIAGSLLSGPRLLLLDEPANGLDPAGIVALRDTLKHLAAEGTTVFVSSHILGEVRQLADFVGIIAAGRLVREGPIETLLREAGGVRVRVPADDADRAREALAPLGPVGQTSGPPDGAADVWLQVGVAHSRAAEVNRTLAETGVYASGVEADSDLEALFLALTAGEPDAGGEGTFRGVTGGAAP